MLKNFAMHPRSGIPEKRAVILEVARLLVICTPPDRLQKNYEIL